MARRKNVDGVGYFLAIIRARPVVTAQPTTMANPTMLGHSQSHRTTPRTMRMACGRRHSIAVSRPRIAPAAATQANSANTTAPVSRKKSAGETPKQTMSKPTPPRHLSTLLWPWCGHLTVIRGNPRGNPGTQY